MDNDGNGTHVLCALPKATAATKQTHNLLSPVRNKGLGYSDKRSKSGFQMSTTRKRETWQEHCLSCPSFLFPFSISSSSSS